MSTQVFDRSYLQKFLFRFQLRKAEHAQHHSPGLASGKLSVKPADAGTQTIVVGKA